jgi:pyridinium-3,5-bisthiocarboxylic acid mononucleotide nickel chelatase
MFSAVITAMRIIWLDCRSEFTGEALVGALADLGVSPSTFEWELSGVEIGDHHLHFDRAEIQGVRGVHFGVHGGLLHVDHEHAAEHHHDPSPADLISHAKLRVKIESANVPDFVKSHSLGILDRIASAQAELVETRADEIEFPESEALEWLVTAVLSCVGLDQLQVKQIYFRQTNQVPPTEQRSPNVVLSSATFSKGSINQPIPASPLGAAILAEFGLPLPRPFQLKSAKVGYGFGHKGHPEQLSILQATLGETE